MKYSFLSLFLATLLLSGNAQAQLALFDTKTVVNIAYHNTDHNNGIVSIHLKEGWHINANPATLTSLIPTEIKLVSEDKNASIGFQYPTAQKLNTPLGDISVYSNALDIPVKLINFDGNHENKIEITAQACDIGTCYPPANWEFIVNADKKN